jgi:hypothetical protein
MSEPPALFAQKTGRSSRVRIAAQCILDVVWLSFYFYVLYTVRLGTVLNIILMTLWIGGLVMGLQNFMLWWRSLAQR